MNCSTPSQPVHHQLPEFTQTHVHRVSDAIQPSHPLSSPSPPIFSLSQHQGLFQGVSSSHQEAKVLKMGGEGDDRGWDGWMASLTQWTWVWVISGSWWWTEKFGMLQSTGSQRVRHNWAAELNWYYPLILPFLVDTNFIPASCKRKTVQAINETQVYF